MTERRFRYSRVIQIVFCGKSGILLSQQPKIGLIPKLRSHLVRKKLSDLLFDLVVMVGCFGFNGPLRQYFSLYRAVSQREGERGEKG